MALRRIRYDWASLPCEFIASILEHLDDYHVDRRRAASTCVSWRRASALVNSKKPSCNKLPFICTCRVFNINPCLCPGLKYYSVLRQSSYYIIISPTSSGRIQTSWPWLIRAQEVGTNKWLLHHPISWKDDYRATPSGVEYNFNLLNEYKILDVAKLHTLHHVFDIENDPFKESGCFQWTMPFVRKVVPLSDLATVLVLFDTTGKLALWTQDSQWSFIDTSYYEIDDIVYLKGQLYAVDKIGRLVTINPTTFHLREIASPPPGGKCHVKVMHLVCSDACLYLVYQLFECTKVSWTRYPRVIKRESWMENRPILFRDCHVIDDEPKDNVGVYVFDKQAGAWVRVENLGDKVFFIANYVAFSVNARELGWTRGSFIYYMSKDFDNGPGSEEIFDVYKLEDYFSTKQGDGDLPVHMALHLVSSVHDLPKMI